MTFPVYFNLFGWRVHPHLVMEILGYSGGFQLFLLLRRRNKTTPSLPIEPMMWLILGCTLGALVGSKILACLESFNIYWSYRSDPQLLFGGKTIVGGLLGGWIGVEVVKSQLGIRRTVGDDFVAPLILGMCLGRVGCFLTGLPDHTYGTATSLPWGVDFGDGIHRHPTQLYEIVFLLFLGFALWLRSRRPHEPGVLFRWFLIGYLGFRFLIEFIKPSWKPILGISAIQAASIAGVVACAVSLIRTRGKRGIIDERRKPAHV